jgi:peptidoglycan hydrolase CwlO-like protein
MTSNDVIMTPESKNTESFFSETASANSTANLIEAMEAQIDSLLSEVKLSNRIIRRLKKEIRELHTKIKTYQSVVNSDLIAKIFKCL